MGDSLIDAIGAVMVVSAGILVAAPFLYVALAFLGALFL